ncbi:MAG: uracil-DNA glycosylase [Alphaproteobacteria bacterium]|nr:uracil-DNA glycosylase [Alphaproteobacteria bacterium]
MTTQTPDMTPEQAAHALAWLVDMGADEVILDSPVNRFAKSLVPEPAKPPVATPPPLRFVPQVPAAPRAATLPDQAAADAAAQAAACHSLEALIQAQNYFEANPLRKGATKLSFMEGNRQADILVLSDRPRNDEDKSGQVVATKARVLLQNMLAAIGLKIGDEPAPRNVMLMNFVPWRPPGNRQPLDAEVAVCLPFASRAIALLQPKLILALGSLGGQFMAGGDASIIRQRGKWLSIGEIPLLATLHPDDLLKAPTQKKLAWRDLQAFKARMNEVLT